ncbi:biotin transporter BioY [Aphanothece hegewaldii]|uniref:biotin transporter BioY n=1 Tax=Aphanothece hegewaldii TaxID=1521625 RepID=UPI001FE31AAA|nr:biotin transporter BioY [Aphanothece hegewaldii]
MNTNRTNKTNKPFKSRPPLVRLSIPNEFLWAFIGLILTIFSTFLDAFITNLPWTWLNQGVRSYSLGVTYQIGAVLLTGCMGGQNAGLLSQTAYVLLGLTWLPVFAQGGGWGYLLEPSFGYLLGFIPGGWLCGFLAFRRRTNLESLAFSAICGLVVIHLCGLLYLVGLSLFIPTVHQTIPISSLPMAIFNYSIIPFPGQLVIICAVALLSLILRRLLFY